MLGVKRIERVLPTGTSLTVVGEAVKDDIGTVRIQRPHKGPFYVSPKTIDQLIENLGRWARWYKYASLGFTVFGFYLIAKHAIRYVMERRRRWELQRRVFAAAAKRSGQDDEGNLLMTSSISFYIYWGHYWKVATLLQLQMEKLRMDQIAPRRTVRYPIYVSFA